MSTDAEDRATEDAAMKAEEAIGKQKDDLPPIDPDQPTMVAGVGASAGGLAALETLFEAMPNDTGIAFVVIQHLSPDHRSLMPDLLSRRTRLPVHSAEDGMQLKPNEVYLLPPAQEMTLDGRKLHLTGRRSASREMPIDLFFYSLAKELNNRAVAIVLSGTGTDGSTGIRTINEHNGTIFVQSPESAEFDGMPRSAIDTGMADFVLPPEEMPRLLRELVAKDPEARPPEPHRRVPLDDDDRYALIFRLLRESYGVDFFQYKPTTVARRILRRMAARDLHSVREYGDLLAQEPDELESLFQSLLIGVTAFFRNPEAYAALEERTLRRLFTEADAEKGFRVWVCGCATGEEAYSLGILLTEKAEEFGYEWGITIFATDIHKLSLETASSGMFSEGALEHLSETRRKRFFRRDDAGNYIAIPALRDMIVFSRHNLLADPPFTRMDLITCRNLLIYLKPKVQERAINHFYFALRSNGILFLGNSETPGRQEDAFEVVDSTSKLYRKLSGRNRRLMLDRDEGEPRDITLSRARRESRQEEHPQLLRLYDSLLSRHIPPGILINQKSEIIHVFGSAGRFLRFREGRPQQNVRSLLSEDLSLAFSTTLKRATEMRKTAVSKG
ncbi:MAG: chemotaxis protein CheB, partial [Verrucomicrobiota bacterium]